jgi:hypothetical protein
VTHPYFGALSLEKLLRFSVIHVRHHAAFLPTFKGSEHLKVSSALTP